MGSGGAFGEVMKTTFQLEEMVEETKKRRKEKKRKEIFFCIAGSRLNHCLQIMDMRSAKRRLDKFMDEDDRWT